MTADKITVEVIKEFYIATYTVPVGTYEYKNEAWVGADEALSTALTKCVLDLNFDFETMKKSVDQITVNKDNGVSGRIDTNSHDYYDVEPKNSSNLEFNYFYVEINPAFVESNYLVYVFD